MPGRVWVLWGVLLVLGVWAMNSGTPVHEAKGVSGQSGSYKLANTINPNEVSWASLARLPGIGRGKARAIVNYREEYQGRLGSDSLAFDRPEDLANVKGVGEVTVERVRSYLSFDVKKVGSPR
jgi:competence protein ComEA